MLKIISVVGARPNFIKIAPFVKEIVLFNNKLSTNKKQAIDHILVHTGQHYDDCMSEYFFKELEIPEPDIYLKVGSGSHSEQVGKTMIEFEKILHNEKPDWVVVVGDVNATLSCSVTTKKENIKCCHIEAGLRSGDMSMPEEINRIVTDRISDLLLTPDHISYENLRREGIPDNQIKFVGNIMIDTLGLNINKAACLNINEIITRNLIDNSSSLCALSPVPDKFALLTLHRPSNVDSKEILEPIVNFLIKEAAEEITILWPVHPRTKKRLIDFRLYNRLSGHPKIILLNPLGYLEMLKMNMEAKIVLTDSGGLQEECTVIGTPCLTLRNNTERPVTLQEYGGTCVLVGNNLTLIKEEFYKALNKSRKPFRPELWDGHTAERCLRAILEYERQKARGE
ncbi:MAG TPA: UDP-N-acetylglucosamine 2-epimerase (non-hydrolyzing) [Bacteroidales bacterium]|nr:UDP-N-acetylglucosamine 2-epimerase (non-hydrolyzing) [Bacteroidales bacterium]HRC88531.1 UDP-N-acetylglucosamine 2-epimerase (non-hydrolyzing) [Bacteroidales bacterium]